MTIQVFITSARARALVAVAVAVAFIVFAALAGFVVGVESQRPRIAELINLAERGDREARDSVAAYADATSRLEKLVAQRSELQRRCTQLESDCSQLGTEAGQLPWMRKTLKLVDQDCAQLAAENASLREERDRWKTAADTSR